VDVTRCQPHHVLHWFLGGPTDPDNLVMLCARHHRMVHEGNWRIQARGDTPCGDPDYWQFTQPTRAPMRR
ncbi:MAG TPA: HNH endonuclease signature motif containing protein, partial [Candidatus Nanopelagicales bacterium]|nr:HNH endonuclease signature motif containing protein [Candidatus Nanopelagicales bacterium]